MYKLVLEYCDKGVEAGQAQEGEQVMTLADLWQKLVELWDKLIHTPIEELVKLLKDVEGVEVRIR